MSTALLNQDFGSESEGEEFNPAPADDSDNEAGSDVDGKAYPKTNGHKGNADMKNEDEIDVKENAGGDDGEDEDEEAEEDEEDEEDAISVCRERYHSSDTSNCTTGASPQTG